MNLDTPLVEVISHLPKEAAQLLDPMEADVQAAVLTQIRTTVSIWEEHQMVFDPVTYEAFLIALVAALGPLYEAYIQLQRRAFGLESKLLAAQSNMRAAEALVEALTKKLEDRR